MGWLRAAAQPESVGLLSIPTGCPLLALLWQVGIQLVGTASVKDGFEGKGEVFAIWNGPQFCIFAYVAIATPKFCLGFVPCGLRFDQIRHSVEIT